MDSQKPQTRGLARRQAMLCAATELFLEKGFERTSLSDIVERSKGSRSTLYEQFGNKEGLLRAMIGDATQRVWEVINLKDDTFLLNEEALVGIGRRFLRAAVSPDALAIFRIVVAEGIRIRGIAQFFFDSGPRILRERLTNVFRQAQSAGLFGPGNPEDMAQIFVGAILRDNHILAAFGMLPRWTDEELDAQVRNAVRVFLRGVGWSAPESLAANGVGIDSQFSMSGDEGTVGVPT
ncbi:TetR/AcrR family transcriptional regulator [Telmatospirillum sp.]|uniref:TetR/AcrR family transcriptional regulator n=1 Tax=Telmatospirillum sp. TaxID=2079197 RepID=UPI002850DC1F|nr:TetR/AcrR family transcriptional regulator [Telmatospirillum sp.]MDR3438890.1 TetR/AcrR family transcriptional regulator [Telmatospirillum sp.]